MYCKFSKIVLVAALVCGLFLPGGPAVSQTDGIINQTFLTLTGAIGKPNRGPYDETVDKFFGYSDIDFKKAASFSVDDLRQMQTVTVKADFPKGRRVHEYRGVLLADVLEAAGATGKQVTVQALDGYAVEAPAEDLIAKGAVVAFARDGKMFGIGDFGPTQIVFPRADRDDLADMNDDLWVWSIFHIMVE